MFNFITNGNFLGQTNYCHYGGSYEALARRLQDFLKGNEKAS